VRHRPRRVEEYLAVRLERAKIWGGERRTGGGMGVNLVPRDGDGAGRGVGRDREGGAGPRDLEGKGRGR
jgi:hypothetical protein